MELAAGMSVGHRAHFMIRNRPMSVRTLHRSLLAATAALAFALSPLASASPQDAAKGEIDHLLEYVAASSCTFVRNGTEYPADKAREHLAVKYRFAGSRIASAEDFIKYLATGSSASGEPYHVKCGKSDALSGEWLNAELTRYRSAPRLQHVSR
jgi:uncharacterized protein DUF5329